MALLQLTYIFQELELRRLNEKQRIVDRTF